ncbi:hypothetical protein C4D60_Mb02t22860 [Musa balbisiana]|uniref:Uncharacterized protein n=1 Tax=Musa balbisiana TaxID=52838 RepID=A0A4S8IF35_MUSBA|nr:hypothetical protein C4D60_Mb02t22860 [Musa balbisiana]
MEEEEEEGWWRWRAVAAVVGAGGGRGGGGGGVAAPAHMQPPPSGNLTLKLGIRIPGSTLRIHHPAFRQSHPRPWRTTALACVPTCLLWTTVSYNDPSFPSF